MHEHDAERALAAIQEESEVRGAAAERYEHMVAMALEAWDDEASRLWKRGAVHPMVERGTVMAVRRQDLLDVFRPFRPWEAENHEAMAETLRGMLLERAGEGADLVKDRRFFVEARAMEERRACLALALALLL